VELSRKTAFFLETLVSSATNRLFS